MNSRLRYVKELSVPGCKLFVFRPCIFALIPKEFADTFGLLDRIRLSVRVWRGYYLYCVVREHKLVGYTFLKRNYLHKYAFMRRGDLLINPYYVSENMRGQGISTDMLRTILQDHALPRNRIWALVKSDNGPSLTVLKKLGFRNVGWSDKRLWSHHLIQNITHLEIHCFEE